MEPTKTDDVNLASIAAMFSEAKVNEEGQGTEEGTVAEEVEDADGEAKADDSQGTDTGEPEPSTDDKVPQDPRIEAMERMLAQQNEMISKLLKEKEPKQEEEPEVNLDALVTPETYAKALESYESFNKLMKDVALAASAHSIKHMYKTLPQLVDVNVSRKVALSTAIQEMLKANKELIPHRRLLGIMFDEIQAEHPELSPIEIIEKHVATRAKATLGIKTGSSSKPGAKDISRVSMAPGSSGRPNRPTKPISTIADEIARMEKL